MLDVVRLFRSLDQEYRVGRRSCFRQRAPCELNYLYLFNCELPLRAKSNSVISKLKARFVRAGWLDRKNVRNLIRIRDSDMFVVSYPKSGNTWIRFVIANLIAPESTKITFKNLEKYVPSVHKSAERLNQFGIERRFIKSHYQSFAHYPSTIYVVRDGRDALVSYYHYQKQRGYDGSFADYLRSDRHCFFGSWSNHVLSALEHQQQNPNQTLLVRYEHIVENPSGEIMRIAQFCGLQLSDEQVAQVDERCRFESLKATEVNFGGEPSNPEKTFFRKGQTGQWPDYFTRTDLEWFFERHGRAMDRLDYR